jgi:uncharacterized OB-fold protein
LTLAYPYARTVGPTYSRFLTGLRERRVEGTRADDGRVFVPPAEFDPTSGRWLDEWVTVADEGTVESWSWQPSPVDGNPLDRPFAWVLVLLDGADTAFLHALDVASPDAVSTGMRVRVRWADEPSGSISDVVCFEPAGTARATEGASGE